MQRSLKTFEHIHGTGLDWVSVDRKDRIRVTWSDNMHQSEYDVAWLQGHSPRDKRPDALKWHLEDSGGRHVWGKDIRRPSQTLEYSEVMASDVGVQKLTNALKLRGYVLVDNTPYQDGEATKSLLERIAFIRETHYGGFYDFIPDLAMADTAYTNLALPAHTDTTYFTDPAGLQAFHLLSHVPAASQEKPNGSTKEQSDDSPPYYPGLGGETLLVDGLNAARTLQTEDPKAFSRLSTTGILWHASGNKGITIRPDKPYPVIELLAKRIHRIRWNNDDRGILASPGSEHTIDWYQAARKWDEILRREENQRWISLKPGTTLIFDNWRVLHGRSAFTGIRRMCGGYINRDDFHSRWMNTNLSPEEIRRRTVG